MVRRAKTIEEKLALREYARKYWRLKHPDWEPKKKLTFDERLKDPRYYYELKPLIYTHEGYTHNCGAHFDNATEAFVHLITKPSCESLIPHMSADEIGSPIMWLDD